MKSYVNSLQPLFVLILHFYFFVIKWMLAESATSLGISGVATSANL